MLVVLAVLGAARTHLHNFPLFLAILLGLAAAIVVAFVATAARHGPNETNGTRAP